MVTLRVFGLRGGRWQGGPVMEWRQEEQTVEFDIE
jgi:hypothetical protein